MGEEPTASQQVPAMLGHALAWGVPLSSIEGDRPDRRRSGEQRTLGTLFERLRDRLRR